MTNVHPPHRRIPGYDSPKLRWWEEFDPYSDRQRRFDGIGVATMAIGAGCGLFAGVMLAVGVGAAATATVTETTGSRQVATPFGNVKVKHQTVQRGWAEVFGLPPAVRDCIAAGNAPIGNREASSVISKVLLGALGGEDLETPANVAYVTDSGKVDSIPIVGSAAVAQSFYWPDICVADNQPANPNPGVVTVTIEQPPR